MESKHIRFTATVEVDLHNVGDNFSLPDACSWLSDALERGLRTTDRHDRANVMRSSAELKSRSECDCYEGD